MAHRAQGELQALGGRRVQRVRKKSNHSPAHRAQPHPADHTHTHTHTPLLTGKHCSPRPSSGGSSRRTRARSSSTSKRSRRRCPCRPSPTTLPARSSKRRAMRWDVQRAACKSPHENRCTKGRRANRCMNMLYFVGSAVYRSYRVPCEREVAFCLHVTWVRSERQQNSHPRWYGSPKNTYTSPGPWPINHAQLFHSVQSSFLN